MVMMRAMLAAGAILLVACGGHSIGASIATGPPGATVARIPSGDWMMFDYDSARSGVGPSDTGITPADLRLMRRRVVQLDGTVDSSPIELHSVKVKGRVHDVIVVTTTYGRTIALDASTGRRLWEFVPSDISSLEGTAQFTTATPVFDPSRRYVYAASPDGLIHKLALSNGSQIRSRHWPVRVTFDPTKEKIAAALNLSGSSVVVTTGGYIGDIEPYDGHVLTIDRSSGRITHLWNAVCSFRHRLILPSSCPDTSEMPNGDNAMWARSGAVIEPGSGRVLVATGNGPFNGRSDWGDSVLQLSPQLNLLSNWTPTDEAELNDSDTDLGSTAPALLPTYFGYHLAVQGGKDHLLHLLNLHRLDGTTGRAGPRLGGEIEDIQSPGSGEVLTAPAVWDDHGRTYVFVADDSGTAAYLLVGRHRPRLTVAWSKSTPGTSPVLAGGLLYVYDEVDGALVIYSPASGRRLAAFPANGGHWNSPIAVGGRIVLPEGNANSRVTSGTLEIYHLPGR